MGTITEDIEFTIKVSQLDDWVKDVKKIVTAELEEPRTDISSPQVPCAR